MFFGCLVKSDLSSLGYCTRVHWTSHFLQGISIKHTAIYNWSVVTLLMGFVALKLYQNNFRAQL